MKQIRRATKAEANALPCDPVNAVAKKIIARCEASFVEPTNKDCNAYLKAVAKAFFGSGIFSGLDANGIVVDLKKSANGWETDTDIDSAVQAAKEGKLVIAAMSGTELGGNPGSHGHVAVVIACEPQESAPKKPDPTDPPVDVPLGYAGSIMYANTPDPRIRGAKLSGTFPGKMVRQSKINYYWKVTLVQPTETATQLLIRALRDR